MTKPFAGMLFLSGLEHLPQDQAAELIERNVARLQDAHAAILEGCDETDKAFVDAMIDVQSATVTPSYDFKVQRYIRAIDQLARMIEVMRPGINARVIALLAKIEEARTAVQAETQKEINSANPAKFH